MMKLIARLTLSSELFPQPVGPVIRSIFPLTKVKSGIRRRKPGVSSPLAEPQVKLASLKRTSLSDSASSS